MRIVFAGSIGRLPVGGHAWVDLQYLLGLRALGHDVFYLEECGDASYVYDWRRQTLTTDLPYPSNYLRTTMAQFGFDDRWVYRAGEHAVGPLHDLISFCAEADLLIVRAVPISLWRPEYDLPRRKLFIDADPLFTQVQLLRGKRDLVDTVERCEQLFTVGQRLGQTDCPVPLAGRTWLKTVPPVFLDEWPVAENDAADCLTSILQWRSYRDTEHGGILYGNKDREFPHYLDLPRRVSQPLCMAVTGAPPGYLEEHGWRTVEGWVASETMDDYRRFIQQSRGEFSVAKHGYVASRCGWFSDRSVCYLASGRPVVVQDTGLRDWLPVGSGVLAYGSPDESVACIDRLNSEYEQQRRAARQIAEQFFDARRVLNDLTGSIG
jgi:hypothetical protein